ncbi:thiamine phosphate synthase [Vulgatibacter incomptus]|uniref:Thiamine-phosphate synthase n=1 Tax=Vulgatibacter incomptus TaxID=1391653 RepID=A0A0K1P8T6_9BACT|nr:thiamine phosphate synthase [Vulgatibacter incomptus]AKU89917.1 Thiamin-phosphate pyrophosphorylase [Vulgatibacter incomptus]
MPLGFRLYLITDRRMVPDLPAAVDRALSGIPPGAAAVQLREKDLSASALLELARSVGAICRRRGAPFLVNDRLDVALAAGADGVHLTGSSVVPKDARALLGSRLVGASCHSLEELEASAGADFATYSPIFASPGKGPAIGLEALRDAAVRMPIVALGGIDSANARDAIHAGASAVAAIRSWLADGDPAEATARLYASLA